MSRGTGTTWRTAHIAYMLNTLLADRQAGTNDPLRTAKSDRASAHIRCFAFAAVGSRGSRRNQSLLISPISLTRQSRPTYNTGKGALKAAKSQRIDSEKNDRPASRMDGDTAGGADGRLRPPRGDRRGCPIRARTPTETRTPRVPPAHVQRRAADSAAGRLRPPRGTSGGCPIRTRTPMDTRMPRMLPAHAQRRAADSADGRLRPPRGASARLSDKDANTYGHTDAAYAPGARATTRGG